MNIFAAHYNPNSHVLGGTIAMIHHFRQLRELEIIINLPSSCHGVLLSSITSTELRKIIILTREKYNWRVFLRWVEPWPSVDKQLCEVVDRLRVMGHRHTLEVELRFVQVEGDPAEKDFTKVLPGFREKGVVTIIDDARGDLIYHSSTHNC